MVGVNLRGLRCRDPIQRLLLKPIQRLVAHFTHGTQKKEATSEWKKEEKGEEDFCQNVRRHHDVPFVITCYLQAGYNYVRG